MYDYIGSKEEFEEYWANVARIRRSDLKLLCLAAVKCECGDTDCLGWVMDRV